MTFRAPRWLPRLWSGLAVLCFSIGALWLFGFEVTPSGGLLGTPEASSSWFAPGSTEPPEAGF